jgi:catechol 2,3-dioxygenase-like lactoylglutathione lyase family enzyme
MTIKQANVTINIANMDRSVSFYRSLGLEMKGRWGDHYAQFTAPGVLIGIHPSNNLLGNSGNLSIGFSVDNIEEAKALLEANSITATERIEEGGQFLIFNDPDGTSLYFIKSKWG